MLLYDTCTESSFYVPEEFWLENGLTSILKGYLMAVV